EVWPYRLVSTHIPNDGPQGVEQTLEVLDRAQGGAHERLHAGRIAIGQIFRPLDLGEALRQPVAGLRGRVEIEEAVELRLERAKVIGEALGLLHELPQERHVLRDAPGDGNVVQGRQFQNLVRFHEGGLDVWWDG